jgi:hypothetical protein
MTWRAGERLRAGPHEPDRRFISVVRLLLLTAVILFSACGDREAGPLSGGRASPAPTATPTPDVALRLMDRVRNMSGIVHRVDRIAATQEKWGDILTRSGSQIPGADPNESVWVVAVVGEVYPSFGRGDTGGYPCGTFVFDVTGNVKSSGASSLSGCARYFSDPLVPPPAPVACPSEPQGYSYDGHGPTTKGPVTLTVSRDDTWNQPTMAPGLFLYDVPAGSGGYYETYCRADHIVTTANDPLAARMLVGLGSPKAAGTPGQAQIWLKDLHAVEAAADGNSVRVLVEPRKGFEIASFDWASVKPQDNTYVRFDYVDRSGNPLIPFRIANGP